MADVVKGSEDRKNLMVWWDGKLVKYFDASVPIMTHSLQYGSAIFEGVRTYETAEGPAIFRVRDHMKRFLNTAKIYFMDLGFSEDELVKAAADTVRANKLKAAYIRPFAFYHDQRIGVSALGKRISVYVGAFPFGDYFESSGKGIKCKVSSWRRINSDMLPVEAKASGNYINSLIANFEAKKAGFDEAIFLSQGEGLVAEGSGENIFIVKNNKLITPSTGADILLGITRDTIIRLAKDAGIEVEERDVHKEELYFADEVFFTGTAAEVTPIINIDGMKIANGDIGPVTKTMAQKYFDVVHGRNKKFESWLTRVKLG